jgi:hypothetical protein
MIDGYPQDEVALKLAALRWYAISLEKLANDIYITDREKFHRIDEILKHAYRELAAVRKEFTKAATDEDGCPPGYVNCDGICLPDCESMNY